MLFNVSIDFFPAQNNSCQYCTCRQSFLIKSNKSYQVEAIIAFTFCPKFCIRICKQSVLLFCLSIYVYMFCIKKIQALGLPKTIKFLRDLIVLPCGRILLMQNPGVWYNSVIKSFLLSCV